MILQVEEVLGVAAEDPEATKANKGRQDPRKRQGYWPHGPVGPRGFPGRDGLSTTIDPLTSTGLGVPPVFNAN